MLTGLDALVFDMQDVGTRFYTYPTTMAYAWRPRRRTSSISCSTGPTRSPRRTCEGPVHDADVTSFIAYMPLPVRYGMTIGELARLFNAEKQHRRQPALSSLAATSGAMWFDETGFAWVTPSPNMRNLEQAVLYPGVGVLEATNISVGRGTDSPFELVGAPWIDGKALAAS